MSHLDTCGGELSVEGGGYQVVERLKQASAKRMVKLRKAGGGSEVGRTIVVCLLQDQDAPGNGRANEAQMHVTGSLHLVTRNLSGQKALPGWLASKFFVCEAGGPLSPKSSLLPPKSASPQLCFHHLCFHHLCFLHQNQTFNGPILSCTQWITPPAYFERDTST